MDEGVDSCVGYFPDDMFRNVHVGKSVGKQVELPYLIKMNHGQYGSQCMLPSRGV